MASGRAARTAEMVLDEVVAVRTKVDFGAFNPLTHERHDRRRRGRGIGAQRLVPGRAGVCRCPGEGVSGDPGTGAGRVPGDGSTLDRVHDRGRRHRGHGAGGHGTGHRTSLAAARPRADGGDHRARRCADGPGPASGSVGERGDLALSDQPGVGFRHLLRGRHAGGSGTARRRAHGRPAHGDAGRPGARRLHDRAVRRERSARGLRPTRGLGRHHRQDQPAAPADQDCRRVPASRQARRHRRAACQPQPRPPAAALRRAGPRGGGGRSPPSCSRICAAGARSASMSATARTWPARRCRAGTSTRTSARCSGRCRPAAAARSSASSATSSNISAASSATSRSASVLPELDALHALGYRAVFLADDNFTVYRRARQGAARRASRPGGAVAPDAIFITQVSIDAARDAELLEMCVAAGLTQVFIGIETPNEASLRETKKRQNLHLDLVADTDRFVEQRHRRDRRHDRGLRCRRSRRFPAPVRVRDGHGGADLQRRARWWHRRRHRSMRGSCPRRPAGPGRRQGLWHAVELEHSRRAA